MARGHFLLDIKLKIFFFRINFQKLMIPKIEDNESELDYKLYYNNYYISCVEYYSKY